MDAYEKTAFNYWNLGNPEQVEALNEGLLKFVKNEDKAELLTELAVQAGHEEYVDNHRIFPHDMREEFYAIANKGCCGSSNTPHKCKSGNLYRIGFNYGH